MEMARVGLDKDNTECRAALNAIEDDDEADEELGRVGQTKRGSGYLARSILHPLTIILPHIIKIIKIISSSTNVPVRSCHFSTKYLFPVEYL